MTSDDESRVTATVPGLFEPVEWVRPPDDGRWFCDMCPTMIVGNESRTDRRYCSNACRQRAYRRRTGKR